MTTALLYLAGIIVVFLVIHFARARSSELWRRSVPREPTHKLSKKGPCCHTRPELPVSGHQEELEGTEQESVGSGVEQGR